MKTSMKRRHDDGNVASAAAAKAASTEMMSSLSASLYPLLLPPKSSTTLTTSTSSTTAIQKRREEWLTSARNMVGISSNISALKLWSEYGVLNNELFGSVRYLVWVCQDVLLFGDNDNSGDSGEYGGNGDIGGGEESGLEVLQCWQRSMESLILTNHSTPQNNNNDNDETNNNNNTQQQQRVMWQMLLSSINTTSHQLSNSYRKFLECNPNIRNVNDVSYCFDWPEFFRGVVVVENGGVNEGEGGFGEDGGSKRRKMDIDYSGTGGGDYIFSSSRGQQQQDYSKQASSSSRQRQQQQQQQSNTAWYPLLGYTIAHAIFAYPSSSNNIGGNNKSTIQQKIQRIQSIIQNLHVNMGIPHYDYIKKYGLISGVYACLLDVLGGGLVSYYSGVDEEGEGGQGGGGEESLGDQCDIFKVEVGQIVELLLYEEGALSSLAKRVNTPLANLVSEAADMILNFSEVHHRLVNNRHHDQDDNDDEDADRMVVALIQKDATKVLHFISKANPQLSKEFSNRKFIPRHYLSIDIAPESELPPMHPVVVEIRARLTCGYVKDVAKICRNLEDCTGIPVQVKQHSYMLLLEKMHMCGTLIEDGTTSPSEKDGELVTLGNIVVGQIGRSCVLEYLANVVLEAREALLSPSDQRRGTTPRHSSKLEELRCVKDAVRRSCLKFLVTRAYSPRDALTISNKISDAGNVPHLVDMSKDHTAVEEATRILMTKLLYEEYNENLDVDYYGAGEDEEKDGEEDGPMDMSVDQVGTPFVSRKAKTDDIDTRASSPPVTTTEDKAQSSPKKAGTVHQSDDIQSPEHKLKRWKMVMSSSKKRQHLVKKSATTSLASPSATPASAARSNVVGQPGSLQKVTGQVQYAESSTNLGTSLRKSDEPAGDEDDLKEEDVIEEVDSDATRSIESNEVNEALDEQGEEEEEILDDDDEEEDVVEHEEEDVTYPHRYHEYPGNYSESDDYEQEDEEEADRHIAFHEPAGDASEGESSNVDGPDVVDLLDDSSSAEDQEEEEEEIFDEDENNDMGTSEEEELRNETEVLNEAVDEYLAAHPERSDDAGESDGDEDALNADDEVIAEIVGDDIKADDAEDEANAEDTDLNMADDEHDTEDDKYSLTEASQQGETFDEGDVNRQASPKNNLAASAKGNNLGPTQEQQQPSVLVAAAMSSQRQSAASNAPLQREPSADNLSFDNTSAALASTDANLSEYYDEKIQGGDNESDQEPNVEVVARHHGHDLAGLDSILDAHADAGDSGDESSTGEKDAETGQGQMTDDGYDAEVSEVEQTNIDKMTRSKANDDDGYLPDAEVSEVEQTKIKKPKKTIEDEGYVPDGGHTTGGEEASEVEQGDDGNKKNKRDVRFEVEANLETTIVSSEQPFAEPSTNLSIDDGYLPTDDGLTEEDLGPTAKSLAVPAPSIDEGYLPDSGAITEEERLEKERKRRRYMDAEDPGYVPDGHTTAGEGEATDASQVATPVKKSPSKSENFSKMRGSSQPTRSNERLDDLIDEGYLPSAVEGTEEERSEGEGAKASISSRAHSEPLHSETEEPLPSVLVATATVLQQGGAEAGGIAQRASLSMKDAGNSAESYISEGEVSDLNSGKVASPPKDSSPALKSPSTSNPPVLPDETSAELAEEAAKMPEDSAKLAGDDDKDDGEEDDDSLGSLTVAKLREKCKERGLKGGGKKAEIIQRIKDHDAAEKTAEEAPVVDETDKAADDDDKDGEEDDDSLMSLTVAKLREKCKERGLKGGGKKAEIIQRIKDHDAAEKTVEETSVAAESKPTKKRGRPRKRSPLGEALEEHDKMAEKEVVQQPVESNSNASSARRSVRAKKPPAKVASKLDTPISALTHHSDSESDDDDNKSKESETESKSRGSRQSSRGKKSIPKAIVTGGKGTKSTTLPVVPEGQEMEETSKPAASSTRRNTRASNKKTGAETTSVASSRRSTRSSTKKDESVASASRVSRRSTKGKSKRFD